MMMQPINDASQETSITHDDIYTYWCTHNGITGARARTNQCVTHNTQITQIRI